MSQWQVDLVIANGTVHTPEGSAQLNVCVANGKIVGLTDAASTPVAGKTIDATGLDVLPGLWHDHTFFVGPAGATVISSIGSTASQQR